METRWHDRDERPGRPPRERCGAGPEGEAGPRRAVVTGIGVVSPVGIGIDAFTRALEEGKSGVDEIRSFDASGFPTRIAAEVKGFDPIPFVEKRKALKLMGKNIQFAMAAARLAVDDARLPADGLDPRDKGVIMGAGIVNSNIQELAAAIKASLDGSGQFDLRLFGTEGAKQIFPLSLLRHLPNMVSCHVSIALDCQGINNTITTACAAGVQAIGEALRAIQRGDARVLLCGASDSRVDPIGMISYSLLGAISRRNDDPRRASRPFDAQRDGFVVGEGAAVFVLEELSYALERGARIYGEVVGYGSAADCYRVTDPHVDGRGSVRAMERAMADAGVDPGEVSYIAAHGTGTEQNDVIETRSIKRVFGAAARRVPASSIKSSVGHLGAACGAISAAATLMAIERGVIPPTINLEHADPECDLDYVPNHSRRTRVDVCLVNSFGFGGQNACLVVRRLPQ